MLSNNLAKVEDLKKLSISQLCSVLNWETITKLESGIKLSEIIADEIKRTQEGPRGI